MITKRYPDVDDVHPIVRAHAAQFSALSLNDLRARRTDALRAHDTLTFNAITYLITLDSVRAEQKRKR